MINTFKKFTASVATAAVISTAVIPAAYAEEPADDMRHSFTDVNPRYEEAVGIFYALGVIHGKSNTLFGTYDNLTRGDGAVILADALGLDTESAPDAGFKDLNERYKGAVNALAEQGIVSGYSPDRYEPYKPLSRGAMAKFLVTAYDLSAHAVETPFTDVAGSFKPFIEALYGTGITTGKTATSFGTYQEITRGDFTNMLFQASFFVPFESDSVEMIDANTLSVTFKDAIAQQYTAEEIAEYLVPWVEFPNQDYLDLHPINLVLSADRKTLTFNHEDLVGREGTLYFEGNELPFDYQPPQAGKGTINIGGQPAIGFDFMGGEEASVIIPAVNGAANLNGLQLTVEDSVLLVDEPVTIYLKSTDVPAAAAGIGQAWGTLTHFNNGIWNLVDAPAYDAIPSGNYVLEAAFSDAAENVAPLTLHIQVK